MLVCRTPLRVRVNTQNIRQFTAIPSHSERWRPIKTSLDVSNLSNRKCFKDFLSFCNDAHSVALLQQTVKGHLVFTVARHYPRSPENLHPRLVIETHVPGPGNEPMVRSTGKSWQKENPESKGRATNWKKYHLTCLNETNIALTDVLWICKKIVCAQYRIMLFNYQYA